MNKITISSTTFPLLGAAVGVLIGIILFSFAISCANRLPTHPTPFMWCSDTTAETILTLPFLLSVAVALVINGITGYDIFESSETLFNVITWLMGVGVYGSIGTLGGWAISGLYFSSNKLWQKSTRNY